jgi:starch phosphorylase
MGAVRQRDGRGRRRAVRATSVFDRLEALGRDLYWTWNPEARALFAALDPVLWRATEHNPIKTLRALSDERREALANEPAFAEALRRCEAGRSNYYAVPTWFARRAAAARDRNLCVAYFSAEFALHECMPQYSGGLGVLAGDHLKAASDLGVPLVGVGLLYRSGYYRQRLDSQGRTIVAYPRHDFGTLPIRDTTREITLALGARRLHARIWLAQVGRTSLYLLDADLPSNPPALRELTAQLYGGNEETRIRQEILLGMGGVRALQALGVQPTVYHLNEGHAAFCVLERLRELVHRGAPLAKAREIVRRSTVFTTHTPVPAGHDRFDARLMKRYFSGVAGELGVSAAELMDLGRERPGDRKEPFCMTVLALRLSGRRNGVAELHGQTTRRMWRSVFDGARAGDVPIGHVTNGVHSRTWLAPEMEPLYRRYLKPRWVGGGPTDDCWRRAGRIPPAELWAMRGVLRRELVAFARQRLVEQVQRRLGTLEERLAAEGALDEHALTLGFARRFATYKRAPLIFHDVRRLARILCDARRPVQLIFAGKAHPKDEDGQAFARLIFRHANSDLLRGRVVLLEDYDMEVGRMLVSGCDVWLNTPLRPHEASGTSGMKPPLHGGLNCSILDGWWPEGYNRRNGWVIGGGREWPDRQEQDRRDAGSLYDLLEHRIVPLFYARDRAGVPRGWARRMIESMRTICGRFSAARMVGEYAKDYYLPAHRDR